MENHNGGVKTKQQMADEYGVCRKTFNKLLIKKNIKLDRGVISPKEQLVIYNELGTPNATDRFLYFPKNSH
jgi:hypothetical protein